jgi:hypothetical protein
LQLSSNQNLGTDAIKYIAQKTEQINTLQKIDERIEGIQEKDETTTNGVF